MKLCSECKETLTSGLASCEDGQEDFPWCAKCVDYVNVHTESAPFFGARPNFDSTRQLNLFEEL